MPFYLSRLPYSGHIYFIKFSSYVKDITFYSKTQIGKKKWVTVQSVQCHMAG